MKSMFKLMNENFTNRVVNKIWTNQANEYYKIVRAGVELENGDIETLKEAWKYETEILNPGYTYDQLLLLNPYTFKKKLSKEDSFNGDKTNVSEKCLYAYAYKGKFLKKYYENGVLNKEQVEKDFKISTFDIDLVPHFKEIQAENGADNCPLIENPELKKIFKGAKQVHVCEQSKRIFITLEYKDWGYDITNIGYRYGAYRFDSRNWIDDQRAIDATLAKIKKIEELCNVPKPLNNENFLHWIGNGLHGDYAANYVTLYDWITIGSLIWHKECENRLRTEGLLNKYERYAIKIFEKNLDPISKQGSWVNIGNENIVGHNYVNNKELEEMYNEQYIPWEDQ